MPGDAHSSNGAFTRELADIGLPRTLVPRLSITGHARCEPRDATSVACGASPLPARHHLSLQRRVDSAVHAGTTDADALHARALITLTWHADRRDAADSAIAWLRATVEMSGEASALADLSAAHLVRWAVDSNPLHLLAALDAADGASWLQPDPAAAFNAALALQRMHLRDEAAVAWGRLASLDPDSPWSREGDAVWRSMPRMGGPGTIAPEVAPDRLHDFARTRPQHARMLAFDRWLGEWGAALVADRPADAATYLSAARTIGAALADAGGDRSVADAVAAIDAAPASRRVSLARAHAAFAAGQRAAAALQPADAARFFREAEAFTPPDPLRLWTQLGRGIALVSGGEAGARDGVLAGVLGAVDSLRYPVVLSRARWAQGTIAIRAARYGDAVRLYESAMRGFDRTGEREHLGALTYLSGEALLNMGDRVAGYRRMLRGIGILEAEGPSVWLHNALIITSRHLEGDGLSRAALRFSNEDVRVTARLGAALGLSAPPAEYLAEAHVARARLMSRVHRDSMRAGIRQAEALLDSAPDGFARRWVIAQLRYARASALATESPRTAIADADSVIATFDPASGVSTRNAARHLGALLIRARARVALGDMGQAMQDLDAATTLIDSARAGISLEGNRHTLADATRDVIDTLVALRLASGDTVEALRVSERGRISVRSGPVRPLRASPNQAVVVWRLGGNRLNTWTLSPAGVAFTQSALDASRLRQTITRVRAAMERRAGEDAVRGDLAWLYDQLVRPTPAHVMKEGRLVTVVPDGILGALPLAALYDTSAQRYWVERHAISVESSLRDALGAQYTAAAAPAAPVLIADPAFDTASHPNLRRLPQALSEVAAIDSVYGKRATVIGRAAATPARLRAALQQVAVVHYAGHAIANDARPEESFLLLAPDAANGNADGRLTADALRALRLTQLRLVVLAACETLGAGGSGSGGFRSLASALRRAGARGVVGSLWRVDDAWTRELMVRFHSAYARDAGAPQALRAAQLDLISSTTPGLRSPSAWAAFQYTGN